MQLASLIFLLIANTASAGCEFLQDSSSAGQELVKNIASQNPCLGLEGPQYSCALNKLEDFKPSATREEKIKRIVKYLEARQQKLPLPVLGASTIQVLELFSKAGSESNQELASRLVDMLEKQEFQYEASCSKGAELFIVSYNKQEPYFSEARANTSYQHFVQIHPHASEIKKIQQDAIDKLIKNQLKVDYLDPFAQVARLEVCSVPMIKKNAQYTVAANHFTCSFNLIENFANNQYELLGSQLKIENLKEYVEIKKCLMRPDLDKILIESSSNLLNNTDGCTIGGKKITGPPCDARTQFCEKGFLELSKKRAEALQNQLLPLFFTQQDVPFDKVKLSYQGTNLDPVTRLPNGTRGECPYEKSKDGTITLRPGFEMGGVFRERLDSARYVRLSVTFKESTQPVYDSTATYNVTSTCQAVRTRCRK